jgi:hypothetical protein
MPGILKVAGLQARRAGTASEPYPLPEEVEAAQGCVCASERLAKGLWARRALRNADDPEEAPTGTITPAWRP